jgi:hypothetical protein
VARVDWRSPVPRFPSVSPLSPKGFALEVIPVALPTDVSPRQAAQVDFDNHSDIRANSANWFRNRAKVYQESQKRHTYNFQAEAGTMDLVLNPSAASFHRSKAAQARGPGDDTGGVMPEALEKLRGEVLQADWPDGTALEFVANHVFVVHDGGLTAKVRSLLEKTHEWRNRRVLVDTAFPVLGVATADALDAALLPPERAAPLRRGETLMPAAFLVGRGGSWTEIFVGEMHALLSAAWPPDRSSPAVHVYWRGARLAVQPLLGANGRQAMELRWRQHRLERVAPQTVAGAILQQPSDSLWSHEQTLQLGPGESLLGGLFGQGVKLHALLVTAR